MSTDRDDRFDDDPREQRRGPDRMELAREKVSTPATMMIVTGVICLLMSVVGIGMMASGYDVQVAMLESMEGMQPPGKAKDDFKKEVEKARTRDKSAEQIQNIIFTGIGITLDVLILIGGFRMKSLSGYTLAMIGSIAAIIPLNGCCCIGMPVGIWALIVLVNADVKAAFAANADGGRPDRRDEGWSARDDRGD